MVFSSDDLLILTASGGFDHGTAHLWDSETGDEIARYNGHSGSVHSVAFSPSGQLVLTGSQDGTAHLWHRATGQEALRFQGSAVEPTDLSVSADGRFFPHSC